MIRLLAILAMLASSFAYGAELSTVQLDKSSIAFVSKQMNVPVEGVFKKFTAQINIDPARPEAGHARVEIDLARIDAGIPQGAHPRTERRGHVQPLLVVEQALRGILDAIAHQPLLQPSKTSAAFPLPQAIPPSTMTEPFAHAPRGFPSPAPTYVRSTQCAFATPTTTTRVLPIMAQRSASASPWRSPTVSIWPSPASFGASSTASTSRPLFGLYAR